MLVAAAASVSPTAVPSTNAIAHGRCGHALAGRDDIIYLGFAVIIVSLIAQGLTLPPLVARLGLAEHPAVAEVERRARLALTRAVLAHLAQADEHGDASPELIDGLRAQYVTRRRLYL